MKRNYDRINVNFGAEIIMNNIRYEGNIKNISDEGIYMRLYSEKGSIDFLTGTILQVRIELPSCEVVTLDCKIVRSEKDKLDSFRTNLGLEIFDKPPQYDEFVKTLYTTNMNVF